MRFVRATFAVAVAFSALLAIANCSLDGLSGGESDGGPSKTDATEGPPDASQGLDAVDQAKDALGDSIPDADAGSVPDYADLNHPPGDGAAFPDSGHECYVDPNDHMLYCAN